MRQIYTGRGAWVWFAIAALNSLACALDLAQRRATPSPSLYGDLPPVVPNHRDRFKTPLRADLAPLCGNGRLDTLVDYEAYNGWNATVEYRLKVNEVCDDGNRLDGDGCSADCASLDAFTPPCALALNVNEEALRFVGFLHTNNTSTLVIFTPTRRMYADAATLQTYNATPIDVNVVSGYIDEAGKVWIYSVSKKTGEGAVWDDNNNNTILAVEPSVDGIWTPNENGELVLVTGAGQVVT